MRNPLFLQRLAQTIVPDDTFRARVRVRLQHGIEPKALLRTIAAIEPSSLLRTQAKYRVMRSIRSDGRQLLPDLASGIHVSPLRRAVLKEQIVSRLDVRRVPWVPSLFKWTAAFAVFLLLIRSLPLVLMAPVLQAETLVQIIASGDIDVTIAGIQMRLSGTHELRGPATIRTGPNSQATVILTDDGVLRIAPDTTVRVLDIGDRPSSASLQPTVMLEKGHVWVLGMLPSAFVPLSVGTSQGIASVNAGSMSVSDDGRKVIVSVYDRGASFASTANREDLLVAGEQLSIRGNTVTSDKIPASQFLLPWSSVNLDMDGVHRAEIRDMQRERRAKMAGILPGSSLYSAKRFSEQIDVIFTLDKGSKEEKIAQQADTRLSEAMTLVDQGQPIAAEKPLSEFKDTLVALAESSGSTAARFLVQRQMEDASSSLAVGGDSDDQTAFLQQTVLDLSTAIPDADQSRDIKGYVLVDKLIELHESLQMSASLTGAVASFNRIQPELEEILKDDTTHPLLKKEASALLISVAEHISLLAKDSVDPAVIAAQSAIAVYLPVEQERQKVLVSEAQLEATVDAMVVRIFNKDENGVIRFKSFISRRNQLELEMRQLRESADPNRGTLLRRLYRKLPQDSLAGYVRDEIKAMSDELRDAR